MSGPSCMLIAGEASGDTLGAELVKALRAESPPMSFFGAGGPKLAAAGVELAFDLSAHAVVGIVEVLKNYRKFKGFFDQLLALAAERQPDYVVLIDYPGFNLRFAKALRATATWKPKIIFYVSPQIWAWHESRIHPIARDIDLLLAIFPFEKAWYAARKPNFRVEFVGHPLVDRYPNLAPPAIGDDARRPSPRSHSSLDPGQANLPSTTSVPVQALLLLPGSRVRELKKHLPPMLAAARQIGGEIHMVLPNEDLHRLAATLGDLTGIAVRIGGLADELRQARAAIASSGTVTLECAYFGVPTVVIYKTSGSTYFLGRRFIRVKYLAMPNLLAGELVYPELIQNQATAENIAAAARDLLTNEARRAAIQTRLREVIATLGQPGASQRAARAILALGSIL